MKEKIVKVFPILLTFSRNLKLKKKINYEYSIFKKNWMYSKKTKEKNGYEIILESHALEKGMTSKKPRYFGVSKVKTIISNLKKYETNNWEKDFAYNFGICTLNEYCKFYEKYDWIDRKEYINCKNYIQNKKSNIESGVKVINKSSFIEKASINYDEFLGSRHSFREFANKKLDCEDVKSAVKMALKTPTACNRQMCKIYYIKNESIKNKVIKYSHGLTNFSIETTNLIVITYDISSLCHPGEITQGMFNAGLVSMNFVNALHSIGIGSCFLEFNDSELEEKEMKNILQIPNCEKIAVVIAAGYYPEESIITCSARKPLEEVYRER